MALQEGVSSRSGKVEALTTAQYVMLAAFARDGGADFNPHLVGAGSPVWLATCERGLGDAQELVTVGILEPVARLQPGKYFTLTWRGAELVRLYALVNVSWSGR